MTSHLAVYNKMIKIIARSFPADYNDKQIDIAPADAKARQSSGVSWRDAPFNLL